MADLVAADVTYTLQGTGPRIPWGPGSRRHWRWKVAFGDGAKTYPSGGVPLDKTKMGCPVTLDSLHIYDQDDAQGIVWKWDAENNKLRGFIQGLELSAAGAGTLDDYPINTTNEPLASGSLSIGLVGGAAGVKYLGRLKEMAAGTSAPAATTLYVEAVGY